MITGVYLIMPVSMFPTWLGLWEMIAEGEERLLNSDN